MASPDPNHVRNTFTVGAALIDQYDTDDLYDPDPNPPNNGDLATLLRSSTLSARQPADYVYGIEGMSFDDPNLSIRRDRAVSHRIRRLCRQATCFSTGVLRMSASLVTPITPLLPLTEQDPGFRVFDK